jgi:hypothetical protein
MSGRAAVLLVVSVLAGQLMTDADRNQLLRDAGKKNRKLL